MAIARGRKKSDLERGRSRTSHTMGIPIKGPSFLVAVNVVIIATLPKVNT